VICGDPVSGLGFCNKHYLRFKKHGDPLKVLTPQKKQCKKCNNKANARGLCGKHYMQEKRKGTLYTE
jgi:hypothetical protein